MSGQPLKHVLKPYIQRASFSNIRMDKLERGDLLYFGYSGAREDTIINPLLLFSGVNPKTGLLEGVNMRLFYINKMSEIAKSVMRQYGHIYWNEIEDDDDDGQTHYEKRKVAYEAANAFTFENLRHYTSANTTQLINGNRQQVNLLERFWRSYKPTNMRFLNDSFSQASGHSISVNLEVASAIILAAPTKLTLQPKIE